MPCFVISYDLRKKSEVDYQNLWDELKRLEAFKTQESVYFISLEHSSEEVLGHLSSYIHKDDFLFVSEMAGRPGYHNGFKGTRNWLNTHFP